MADFRDILDHLVVIQKTVEISDPRPVRMKNAYKYPPSKNAALDAPSVLNTWTFTRSERHTQGGTLRHYFTVHQQLFVYDADEDRAADIATAFLVAYINTLASNITLGGAVKQSDLHGGNPTLVTLEWGGKPYIGLQLDLDVFYDQSVGFA